jgi:hypothetical protein
MQDFTDVLVELERRVDEAESYLRIGQSREEATQLESKASSPGLWDNQEEARKVTSQLATLKDDIEHWERVRREVDDASALFELAREEDDDSLESEITLLIESVVAGSMMKMMRCVSFTQVLEEQTLAIGQKCFFECTCAGRRVKDLMSSFMKQLMAVKQELALRLF